MTCSPRRSLHALIGAGLLVASTLAHAQDAGETIELVEPYASRGMGSVFASMVTELPAARLKAPVVVDYIRGANDTLGREQLAQSASDCDRLLLATAGSRPINPALQLKLRDDSVTDVTPVAPIWMSHNVLYANRLRAGTLKDLVQFGASESLSFGALGVGTLAHLAAEMLIDRAAMGTVHIPFKGQGQVMLEVALGRLDFAFSDSSGLRLGVAGGVQALAATPSQRLHATCQLQTAFSDASFKAKLLTQGVQIAPDHSLDRYGSEVYSKVQHLHAETRIALE